MYAHYTLLFVDGSGCQLPMYMVQFNQYILKHHLLEVDNFKSLTFVIHSSPPVIKNVALRNILCESWIIILNEHNFTKHEF